MRPWLQGFGLAVLTALLLVTTAVAVTPQGRTGMKTALFVTQVLPMGPVKPLEWVTRSPHVERVQFQVAEGLGTADVYRPAGDGPHPAVLLFLGVAPAGPDDERVRNLGEALARVGTVTMFYWSEEKLAGRIEPDDVDDLIEAFRYLRDQPFVDEARVGMGGFCVGASFVLLAAAREEIRDDVAFINAFAPYFDMRDLTVAIASGTRFDGEERAGWQADSLTREVFERLLLESIDDEAERTWLERRLFQGGGEEPPGGLSAEARAVRDLLDGVSLEQARSLLPFLSDEVLQGIDDVSPSGKVEGLRTKVFVMHDEDDTLVPAEESRRLRRALEAAGVEVRHTEFTIFEHIDPNPGDVMTFLPETLRLFFHLYSVFRLST